MDAKISICHELFSFKKCKKLRRDTAAFKALLEGTVWYISIRDAAALLRIEFKIHVIFNVIARHIVGVAEGPYVIAAEGPSDESAIIAVAGVAVNAIR